MSYQEWDSPATLHPVDGRLAESIQVQRTVTKEGAEEVWVELVIGSGHALLSLDQLYKFQQTLKKAAGLRPGQKWSTLGRPCFAFSWPVGLVRIAPTRRWLLSRPKSAWLRTATSDHK